MKQGYVTIEEWKKDMQLIQQNPRDEKFVMNVARRLNLSSEELQNQVRQIVENKMMDEEPHRYFQMIAAQSPKECVIIFKSKDDPWFNC